MERARIEIPREALADFCRKWQVAELPLFGSVLRGDFRPESDVDVLVAYRDEARWDLWDHMHAEEELRELLGRDVDLVDRRALRNPFRRHQILSSGFRP